MLSNIKIRFILVSIIHKIVTYNNDQQCPSASGLAILLKKKKKEE